jgi:hypothetical protein
MKYEFDECIRRLKLEIDSVKKSTVKIINPKQPATQEHLHSQSSIPASNSNTKETISNQTPNELTWVQEDVEKWFAEKNLNLEILNDLKPCDGKLLRQLFIMSNAAPDFFYHALSSKKYLSLRDTAMFASELAILFQKK